MIRNSIKNLQKALEAAGDIIGWYEDDSERSCHADDKIPEDLRKLEKIYESTVAKSRGK